MKKVVVICVIVLMWMVSCKKTRVCECKNSTGTYDAGETEMTRSQAKKYCKGLSLGETTCSLKK